MKKENLIMVENAMKFPEVIKLVGRASERIWHKVNDVTSFEHSCYRDIGIAIASGDVKSIGGIATRIISRKEAWHVKHRGKEPDHSLESLARLDDEGHVEPFEVKDVLADVERKVLREVIYKENVALLAKDDVRKRAILKAWTIGYLNASELSGVLANTFGGKAESHRKSIQRFEIECKKRLKVA